MSGKMSWSGAATAWHDLVDRQPAHRNALNNTLIEALTGHFKSAGGRSSLPAIVVRGRGGMFCAGRELRDLRTLQDASNATIVATYEKLR